MWLDKYKVQVPEGVSGAWRVERFTVSESDEKMERLYSMFNGGRYVPAGTYTWLKRSNYTIMSDTPDEIRDHLSAISKACGNVLINGLGLGVVLQAMARKPEVITITVIEQSSDVIALVAPHYQAMFGDKINIIQADAYEYKPPKGSRFDVAWHDIWDDLCADNLPKMAKLHQKYGRLTDWQGSWGKEICQRHR